MVAYKKKVRFKKYVFKLSFKQKELIDKFCKIHKTTPNKLIRKSVKEFLVRNVSANDDYYISENQLSIFDEIDDENDVRADDENGFTLQDSPHN